MAYRKRIGHRRWTAQVTRHDGTVDDYGQPTYSVDDDWDVVIAAWPCELVTTVGGEVLRGRMVNTKTTHVAFGEFFGVSGVTTKDRITINGVKYGVVAVIDADGLQTECRIELRGENDVSV